MIEFKEVAVRRDGRVLFSGANFQLHPNQKIGLTGNNGTGKSTLFALILTQMQALGNQNDEVGVDSGALAIPSSWQVAHMAQEVAASDQSAINYVLSGDEEWFSLNEKLNHIEALSDDEIAQLHQRFDEIDGYKTSTKAAQIMSGLGFLNHQHELPVAGFSGGWRMRLNLAKTLMSRADLLLLDEPTNHLDLDAILWLETWINQFSGLIIVISHDQAFLDATVNNILHVEQQKITLYSGNYQQFIRTRSERLAQQQQAFEKQQATRAHLDDFIRRFRAKASKAKQAQSRIKQLERMSELTPVMADNPFSFQFYAPTHMSSPLIVMSDASIGYDHVPMLNRVNLQVTPDSRIGLLGINGAGKSTLIKALVGELPLISGQYRVSDTLKLGYFNQHQMDSLDENATPMQMLRRLAGLTSDADLRSFLGSFDFRGDRIDTQSKLFSGGERARLTLALIVWQRPNVLVLDEPTNHLDLQMRQALTFALQSFEGAVVLVSHDRELVANVCDELYLVHDGAVDEFDGDIHDYGKWISDNKKQSSQVSRETKSALVTSEAKPDKASTISKEALRKQAAEQRKQTAPLRKQIANLETELENASQRLTILEETLADVSLYEDANKNKLLALLEEQSTLQQSQDAIEERLLDAMSELEALENLTL